MNTSTNRCVLVLAAALSLVGHVALAAIFLDKDEDAKIAGGATVSIAIMGDASMDQVMAGELTPNDNMEYHEAKSDPAELTAETPLQIIQDIAKESAVLDAKPKAKQVDQIRPVKEIKADQIKPNKLAATITKVVKPTDVQSELLNFKTASILSYDNDPTAVLSTTNKQILTEKFQEPVEEVLDLNSRPNSRQNSRPNSRNDTISEVTKTSEQLEARTLIDAIPVPQFRPIKDYEKPVQTAKLDPKPTSKKLIKRPVKKSVTTKKAASGRKGNNKANVKKGTQAGKVKKGNIGSTKRGQSNAAGNSNMSNYKGKIRQRIYRRFNPKTRPAKRDAVISFTISRNGSANAIRLTRSSGNAKLDRAALTAVKRASPFPSLPAGKSKLVFNVGLNAS